MKRAPRHRVIRPGFAGAVKIALLIAFTLELVYLVAANLILDRWLRSWINGDEQALRLDYSRAWSPWPGRVYAQNLTLRVQDSNVQFELQTTAVTLDVVLTALLSRTFRATYLDVEGVVFKFRHKLEKPPDNPRLVRALPPIEGFADPPLMEPEPSEPAGKLWSIHITDVDARIDELWIQQFRTPGAAHAWGGFRLEPTRRLVIESAALLLEKGALYAGKGLLVARDFRGRVDAGVKDTDLRTLHGWHALSRTSTRVQLKGELVNLDFLKLFLEPEQVRTKHGGGPLNVDVRLADGVFQAKSRVTYASSRVEVHSRKIGLFGDAMVELAVAEPGRGRLSIAASELGIDSASSRATTAPISFRRPRLELETHTLALHQTWKTAGGRLEAPELVVSDLHALERLLPEKIRLAGGPLTGRARAQLARHGALEAELELKFREAHVTRSGVSALATGRFETSLFAPRAISKDGELRNAVLEIERGVLRTTDGSTGIGPLKVRADRIPYSDFVPMRVVAEIDARFADARPLLKTLGVEPKGLAAAAAALFDLSDLELLARARYEGGNIDLILERARTDAVQARGQWRRVSGDDSGAFLLATDLVNVGLEISDGETTVLPLASESWLERVLAELRSRPLSSAARERIGPRPAPARVVR